MLAWQAIVTSLLMDAIPNVSLIFSGHMADESILGAVGLSVSAFQLVWTTVYGLSAALETLAAQAWGAQNYTKIGRDLQKGILILGHSAMIVYGLWFNAESILNLLHQPPCVVKYATQYMSIFSLALPALFVYTLLRMYLQAQDKMWPIILAGIIANIVNILAHYVLIFVAQLGIQGAAIAATISANLYLLTLVLIIYLSKIYKKTNSPCDGEMLKDWGHFIKLGAPGLFMLMAGGAAFECGTFVLGLVSTVEQGIYVILVNITDIVFSVIDGLGPAAAIRIGNELGAGKFIPIVYNIPTCNGFLHEILHLTNQVAKDAWLPWFPNLQDQTLVTWLIRCNIFW